MRQLAKDATLVAEREHLSAVIDDEEVILDMESGTYYGVNTVGSHIWTILQDEPTSVEAVIESVVAEFDVRQEDCEGDVMEFLNDVVANGLVETADAQ